MRRTAGPAISFGSLFLLIVGLVPGVCVDEPSYEQAVSRWPDIQRPIAYLGCKDHRDEFGVMWNGNISIRSIAMIDGDRRTFEKRKDASMQVSFAVGDKPNYDQRDWEDASTEASLAEGYLPVVQVRIKKDEAVLREEAFVTGCASRPGPGTEEIARGLR